eukprot:1990489-Prorocentrum_lima.AAC.1
MTLEEVDGKAPPTGKRGRRICQQCEVECRREEWQSFTPKEMRDNPDYATPGRVWHDLKESNKGDKWRNDASYIARAKSDIRDENAESKRLGTYTSKSHKQQKLDIIHRAQQMSEAF